MKLIYVKESNGSEHYLNPIHVDDVKVVKSNVNKDWCIVISHNGVSNTILCKSEEERDQKLAEIKAAMESI